MTRADHPLSIASASKVCKDSISSLWIAVETSVAFYTDHAYRWFEGCCDQAFQKNNRLESCYHELQML